MSKQVINNSTVLMRATCAVVFFWFSFCYLFFYQADILAVSQHVYSGGKTVYEPTIGAILITLTLYLLQLLVFAITRLYKRAHALTYFPSLLALTMVTSIGTDFDRRPYPMSWVLAAVVLLGLFAWAARVLYLYQPYEPKLTEVGPGSRLMWTNLLTLTAMMLLTGLFGNSNDVFHYRMRMESLMRSGRYEEATLVGKKSAQTDSSLVMLRAFALAKQGQLGEHLFEYPLTGGSRALFPNGASSRSIMFPELEIHRFSSTKAADDYRLCAYLMDGDLVSFAKAVAQCYNVDSPSLPKHYKEALTLYVHKSQNPVVSFHNNVLDADYADFRKMELENTDDLRRANAIRDVYRNTYWYYYLYNRGKH